MIMIMIMIMMIYVPYYNLRSLLMITLAETTLNPHITRKSSRAV